MHKITVLPSSLDLWLRMDVHRTTTFNVSVLHEYSYKFFKAIKKHKTHNLNTKVTRSGMRRKKISWRPKDPDQERDMTHELRHAPIKLVHIYAEFFSDLELKTTDPRMQPVGSQWIRVHLYP